MDFKKWLLSTKMGQMAVDRYGIENLIALGTGLVILVVIGMVGIYIASEVHTIAGITTGSVFYTASGKVINVMNTGWGLVLIPCLSCKTLTGEESSFSSHSRNRNRIPYRWFRCSWC